MPRNSRTLLTVALASMALVAAAGPVAAHDSGDGDAHRGKTGKHKFRDSLEKPGARCVYQAVEPSVAADEAAVELVGVKVRPPKVWAIDRNDRVNRQPVAWRFILQEKSGDGEWTKVKRSRTQVRRASDRRAANFKRLGVRYDGDPAAEYRVKSKAYWLSRRNPLKKVGAATHVVDYYKVRGAVEEGSCPGGIPAPETP